MNRKIKKHLLKLVIETKMPWVQLMPLALAKIRARPRGDIQLSPFELMFGIPYPYNSQPSGGVEISDVYLKQYVARILSLVKSLRQEAQLEQTLPMDFAVHNIQPGDWVLVKEWKEAPLVAKWRGPFQVLLTTETAVMTAEHGWTDHTRVKVSEAPEIWTSQLEEKYGKS
ncbi:hypothetical protein DUI87_02023 [Hirundo rustica rustica]|uniref:Murine leukemia virus integrase C-terminal domain-containing protein n=1 Tax=Hirundo rustica rustica TaxID=333673 RepID=A0A3M0L748_HIRRU|nr:hypothetical protein DUI87_02023 [Hirundo rustica rustica]